MVVHQKLPSDPDNPLDNPRGPTFVEFIKTVLIDGVMDQHWQSMERYCAPCAMDYDVVVDFR